MQDLPRLEPDSPPGLPLWRRVSWFVPWWAWLLAAVAQVAVVLPFWLHSVPAPFHDVHGDVYRGWPAIYGLDQGDVVGDEWGPFVTYLHPGRLVQDTAIGVGCGLPLVAVILWAGRRVRRWRGPPKPGAAPDTGL